MDDIVQHAASAPADSASPTPATLAREWREAAFADLRDGLLQWPLWYTIGWMDVKQRYRRSLIGPFWITLSLGVFVLGSGFVYGALFKQDLRTYLPFLAAGVIVWTVISTLIVDGCMVFTNAEGAIKQLPVPISVHVYRTVWRTLIVFGHNLLIYVLLVLVFGVPLNAATLLALPGLVLIALTGVGIALTLGILSARFRDIPLIITNLVQLVFFTTPILWRADTLPAERAWVANLNPFFHLIEVVRQPLLGHTLPLTAWLVTSGIAAAALGVGILFYARYRVRVAYWL